MKKQLITSGLLNSGLLSSRLMSSRLPNSKLLSSRLLVVSTLTATTLLTGCVDELANYFDHLESKAASVHTVETTQPQPLANANSYQLPYFFSSGGKLVDAQNFVDESGTLGLVITKDGKVVYESYREGRNQDDTFASWSMAKSVVSALVGIAIDEGYIASVDDRVVDYLPEFKDSVYADVTIRNLLTMSSGVKFDENMTLATSDLNKLFASMQKKLITSSLTAEMLKLDERQINPNTGQPYAQGEYNAYKSADTQMLGLILRKATNQDVATYLQDKIWQPTGMRKNATWMGDKDNVEGAFCCLKTTTRDMAKFGNIYLNQGAYNGQQIVPQQWVSDSLDTSAAHLVGGDNANSVNTWAYGYQWWLPPAADNTNAQRTNDFVAVGVFNQFTYVSPINGAVVAKHSAPKNYLINNLGNEHTDFFKLLTYQQGKTYKKLANGQQCLTTDLNNDSLQLSMSDCQQDSAHQFWYLDSTDGLLRSRLGGCLSMPVNAISLTDVAVAACDASDAKQQFSLENGKVAELAWVAALSYGDF